MNLQPLSLLILGASHTLLLSRLESQCVTAISFVKNEPELLDSPIWILIINIVALEMLKAKLPPGEATSN